MSLLDDARAIETIYVRDFTEEEMELACGFLRSELNIVQVQKVMNHRNSIVTVRWLNNALKEAYHQGFINIKGF